MSSIVERCSENPRVAARAVRAWWMLPLLALTLLGWAPAGLAQPANDNFANATVISGGLGTTNGSTVAATIEPGEPFHWGVHRSHSVWFRWTAPTTGFVTVDTFGSSFDTILAAYTGSTLGSLAQIASNDDTFSLDSQVIFFGVAGTEYRIAVDGYFAASGFYRLNWIQEGATNPPPIAPDAIEFASGNFGVDEALPGYVTVSVIAGGGFTNTVTVDYFTTDGSAVAGVDYLSVSNKLTFAPGDTVKTFTIPLNDNFVQDSNRTINIHLANPSAGAVLSALSNSIVTIVDNETLPFISDAGNFSIVANAGIAAVVTENETTPAPFGNITRIIETPDRSVRGALITVRRSAPASGRVMVDFYTTNSFILGGTNIGSAQPNFDYTPVSGTLVFDDYQMMANFIVPILNSRIQGTNFVLNGSVYFDVVLHNARPAPEEDPAVIVPTISVDRARVQINKINNAISPNLFSIERKTYRADEYANFDRGGSNVLDGSRVRQLYVDVILPGGGPGNVNLHVDVQAYGFPLLPGSDYADDANRLWDSTLHTDGAPPILNLEDYSLAANGGTTITLNFGPGQTRQSTRIQFTNDNVVEFNEDILIRLTFIPGNPDVNALGARATATILYDDQPAGAADREWNPEGVIYTNPRYYTTPGADSTVAAVVVQPDNRTVIGGGFTHYNSVARNRIARIEPDGSLDSSFNPGTGADGGVGAIALYPTNSVHFGKILIGGAFTSFDGARRNGVARLNSNGSLDLTFAPGNGADGIVRAVAVQNDGKVLIAGGFTTFNDISFNGIVRLNEDGSIDSEFNPGLNPYFGPNGAIWSISVQEVGTNRLIYVAGEFSAFTDQPRMHLARLLNDGSVDLSFDPGLGTDGPIYATALQGDGKLLIGGAFYMYHTFERSALARINPDGSLDQSYLVGTGADDSIYTIAVQPDGKAVIGGVFNHYNSTRRMGLARLFRTGALDTSFMDSAYNHFAGLPRTFSFDQPSFVRSLALDTNGHVMIGGSFTNVGGNLSIHYPLSPTPFGSINGRTNGHNSGAHPSAPFTRQDKTTRFNIARILGGYTPGPGNIEIDPGSLPFSINENSQFHAITMRRVDGRLGGIGATLSTTDNTAVSPGDFSPSINAQNWPQGMADNNAVGPVVSPESVGLVRRTTFNVPINDDSLQEGDETFGLVVSNAFGSVLLGGEEIPLGAAFGWHQQSLGTISDNDFSYGTFNFKLANYITNENAIYATISVIRTNGTQDSVEVDYYTRSISPYSTATAGTDYTRVSGTLIFGNTEFEKTFVVPLLDNPEVEQDEIVSLVLTNATAGAKLHGGAPYLTATLTIVDNDFLPGRLQFSSETYTNSEQQASAVVTVQRTGGTLGGMTVDVQTILGGTAAQGSDYLFSSNKLSWNHGDSSARSFTVPLLADGSVEGPESIFVRLSNPSTQGALGSRSNTVVWINDADAYGVLSFNQGAYEGDENGNPANITVTRSQGSSGAVSVWYTTRPITAAPGVDYVTTSNRLDFANGEFSKTFQVPLLDNTVPDGERTLQLALLNPVNATLGGFTNVVLTIIDNESINLPAGSLDTTFSAQAAVNAAVYALAQQQDGKIIMAGDFTLVNNVPRNRLARLRTNGTLDGSFDIGPGANNSIRALALQSDGRILIGGLFNSVNGTNRNAVARLSTDGQLDSFFNPGAGADNPVYALVVQPDDKVLVGGSFSTFNGSTRPGLVRLDQHGSVDGSFSVGAGINGTVYAIALQNDGKILVGGEFVSFNGVARTNLVRLNVNGTLDNTFANLRVDAPVRAIHVESNGRIVIGGSFTNISGIPRQYLARLSSSGVVDPTFLPGNDLASLGADNTVYAIKQQVDGKLLVAGDFRRFNGVTRNGITRLKIEDGSTDPTINFGNGANGFVSSLLIQPDRRIVLGGGFTQYDDEPRQHVARIYGGSILGSGNLEFSRPLFLVSEQGTNAVISVRRVGGTAGSVSADFETYEASALAGVDFVPVSGTLASFTEGETRGTFTVPILGNSTLDGDRELYLLLQNFVGAGQGPQPFAVLRIVDDESAVGFSVPYYTVSESPVSGNATVSLIRRGNTNSTFTVEIASADGTATAGLDYLGTNRLVSFQAGERFKNFNVRIINDTNLEGNEAFSLNLSNPTGFTLLDATASATVSIMDDDSEAGQFLFSTNNFVVDEFGNRAVVTVLRTNGTRGIVSVLLTTSDGSAQNGMDYIGTNHVVTFADGETAKSLAFPIIDDGAAEPDETILLTLSSPNNGASIQSSNAIVTISDNETPSSVGFQTNSFFVAENAGFAQVNVVRSGNRSSVVSVDFATGGGSATAGVDYAPSTTTVTFQQNEVLQSVLIPINDDMLGEGAETVGLTLSNVQSSSPASLSAASSTLVIVEDDSTVRFASAAFTAIENQTNALITVVRGGDTNAPITVTYTTRPGGTAVAGLDYRNVSGTLSWAGGDGAPKTFLVPVIDNTSLGADRSLTVALTNVVGVSASIENPSNAVLTIVENELGTPVSGVVDPSFNGNLGANLPVHSLAFDAQQRVVLGGDFTYVYGYPVNRITRLTTNGAVDVRFNVGSGADAAVYSVAAPSNFVYLAGAFTNVNGVSRPGVARLLNNGSVDPAFNTASGANAPVYAVAPFRGGAFVAGDFTLFGGNAAGRVALLTTNGTVDAAFVTGSSAQNGANGAVHAIAVQTNGQVVIGGDFTTVNNREAFRLARLNPDGSVDTTFKTGIGADARVRSIVVQPDGKILIGGEFQTINGSPRAHVARLNADGSVDISFNPGFGASSDVRSLALQADGRILVVGSFTTFDGNAFRRIARLNANGSVDAFFGIGTGADGDVNAVATYSIPAPIVCEPPIPAVLTFDSLSATNFAAISNYTENCVAFFGPTGGVFHAVSNVMAGGTAAQLLATDGSLLELNVGGRPFSLLSINFLNLSGPVIVTSSLGGSTVVSQTGFTFFDSTFSDVQWVRIAVPNGAATIDDVMVFSSPAPVVLPTDRIAVGGDFRHINGVPRERIAVLDYSGAVDIGFDPGAISTHTVYAIDIHTNLAQPDLIGKVVAGGDFLALVGAEGVNYVGRLNIDGTIDKSFNIGVGPNGAVRAVAVQPDGKAIIGGFFTTYDFLSRSYLARLNVDGTLDPFFNIGAGLDNAVLAMALQPDGKTVIGGAFTHIYGAPRSFIGRVHTNGTVDTNFLSAANGPVRAVALQVDGKVLIGGEFTTVNGVARGGIARLNANGTLDTSFNPAAANAVVNAIAVTPAGQVLVGGAFSQIGGNAAPRLARLNGDGSFDSGFAVGSGGDDYVSAIKVQPDGKILVGGNFTMFNDQIRNRLVRLNSDGSFDPAVNFGTGANNFVSAIALQSYDNKIVVGGGFTRFDDEVRVGIARLFNGDNTGSGAFEFATTSYAVNESAGTVTLTVARRGGTFGSVSISYATANGSASAPGDYGASSGALNFAPAESVKYITIPIIDNVVMTGDRTFTVTLSNPTGGASLAANSTAEVTIMDNDSIISFTASSYVVNEAGIAARITVVRDGGLSDAVSVDYATGTNGTATAGADFTERRSTLVFNPGVRIQSFDVPVVNDIENEFNETVPLSLFNLRGQPGTILGLSNAALTIIENDFAAGVLGFSTNIYAARENDATVRIDVVRTNGFNGVVSVFFATGSNQLTVAGVDFYPTNGTLTFNDGQSTASFFVRLIDDQREDGQKIIPLMLSAPTGGAQLGLAAADVLIQDNEAPGVFSLSSSTYSVTETGLFAVVTVLRVGGYTNENVTLQTIPTPAGVPGGATAGADYTSVATVLTFAPGQTSTNVLIPILDDTLAEGTETLEIELVNATPPGSIGAPATAILSIFDDEITVEFNPLAYQVLEGNVNLAVNLVRRGDTNSAFTVGLNTANGSATANNDYFPLATTLNFAPGETNKVFLVAIREDGLAEGTETFALVLSNPSPGVQIGTGAVAQVTILDNDIALNFSAGTYSIGENTNTLVVTVNRSGDASRAITVDYLSQDGTANAPADYLTSTGRLVFAAGVTSLTFNVSIVNDLLVEGIETLNLALANPSIPFTLGAQAGATVNILDDDTLIAFERTTYIENEKNTNAVIRILRSGIATAAASVQFRTTNGTALAGVDYTPVVTTVRWAAGDSAPKTVLVPLTDDGTPDGPETVRLVLENPTGAALDFNNASALLTITDQGGAIAFTSSSYSVVESDGDAVLSLVRTGGTNGVVYVDWAAQNGTAIAGQDYSVSSGTVTFVDGQTTASIRLPVNADGIVEGVETLNVVLVSARDGARVGSPNTATLRIIDGDAGVIVGAGAALVAESISTNNIIESNEVVTVLLGLRNNGLVNDTINATLVYSNGTGVMPTNAAAATNLQQQSYGELVAGGSAVSRPFTFRAVGTNGARVDITLLITNSAGVFLGDITFTYTIGRHIVPFGNAGVITIPVAGAANPYPSTLTVSGVNGPVHKLTVTLFNVSHDYPDDIDMVLVAPDGRHVMLMSDSGLGGPGTANALRNVTLTFDDEAEFQLPDSGVISNAVYRPANHGVATDPFPSGGPAAPFSTSLSTFNGVNPNGVWSLFIHDDSPQYGGTIAGGWSLNIQTADPVIAGADLSITLADSPDPVPTNGTVTYTISVTNHGPAAASTVKVTNSLPAGATFISSTPASSASGNTVVLNFGTLPIGAGATGTITLRAPNLPGAITLEAMVGAGEVDLNPGNNFASVKTTVLDPTVLPAPVLFSARKGNNLILSWQHESNVALQSKSLLGSQWDGATNSVVVSNGVGTVTVPLSTGSSFYRLKRQ